MNHSTSVTHNAGTTLPRAFLAGTAHSLPLLEFGDTFGGTTVAIAFYTTPDPAQYLRDLASLCIGLAEQVDAMPKEASA